MLVSVIFLATIASSFKVCRLLLLADRSYATTHQFNMSSTENVIANVSQTFQAQFDVSIEPVAGYIDFEGTFSGSAFADVSIQQLNEKIAAEFNEENYCAILLLTSNEFTKSTVGVSFIGRVCDKGKNAVLVSDNNGIIEGDELARIVIHELGHLFGADHDSGICAKGRYVMFESVQRGKNGGSFSPCSAASIIAKLQSKACLMEFL